MFYNHNTFLSDWFPGWSQHNHVLRQPNDDFLSEEDCVELRRLYHHPGLAAASERLTESFMWNDRDCSTRNYFICEKLQMGAGESKYVIRFSYNYFLPMNIPSVSENREWFT